jgi:aconitate hydratase
LPLTFTEPAHYDALVAGTILTIDQLHSQLRAGSEVKVRTNLTNFPTILLNHALSPRQLDILKAGGIINQLNASYAH